MIDYVPYTNFHELNLDWIVKTVKEYVAKTDQAEINFNDLKEYVVNSFNEIKTYLDNYFDNLDVQEEINNKLDEMAEGGQLQEIIAAYLELSGVLAFNTLSELKNATNLADGSVAMSLGLNVFNDRQTRLYKVRPITNTDVIDDYNIIALANYPTLVGELANDLGLNDIVSDLEDYNVFSDVYTNSDTYIVVYGVALNNQPLLYDKQNDVKIQDYVKAHDNFITANGSLAGPYSHDNVFVQEAPVEATYYLGWNNTESGIEFNFKDITTAYTEEELHELGAEGMCIWSPILLNGARFNVPNNVLNHVTLNGTFNDYIYTRKHPRAVIAQNDTDTYILVFSGRYLTYEGVDYDDMVEYLQARGYKNAFNLDGGGSTALYSYTNRINPPQEPKFRYYPGFIKILGGE